MIKMRYPINYVGITKGFKNTGSKHYGIDFGWNSNHGGKNVPIYAVDDGKVIYNKYQLTGGYVIHIKHNNGYVSEYAHLKKGSIKVKLNQKVKKGEQIANMGGSGIVTGNHLHFGLYKGDKINYNKKANFVNPINYLCLYKNQNVGAGTDSTYHIYKTKIVKKVPLDEILNIRYKNGKIVSRVTNGDEVEYYGLYKIDLALVDNIEEYTTLDKYLW